MRFPSTSYQFKGSSIFWIRLLVLLVLLAGCEKSAEVVKQEGNSVDNLMEIQAAYQKFIQTKRKPPASQEDIMQFIAADRQATVFTSPRDGKPYKIYWGASLSEQIVANPTIIAHEQDGDDGLRYVMSTMGVMAISDREFKTSSFPAVSK